MRAHVWKYHSLESYNLTWIYQSIRVNLFNLTGHTDNLIRHLAPHTLTNYQINTRWKLNLILKILDQLRNHKKTKIGKKKSKMKEKVLFYLLYYLQINKSVALDFRQCELQ